MATEELADLRPIDLPAGLQPSTLAVDVDRLVVAGHLGTTAANRRPAMAVLDARGSRSIPLTPHEPYAAVADIFSVATVGTGLQTLGVAHGGAHANPRWTTWGGTTSSVVDHPQVFWTFGGEEAGILVAIVATPAGPRIVGSWQGKGALDIAIWRPDGEKWTRLDSAGTPLANTATLQVSGRSAAATPAGMIVAGSVFDLSSGVHQLAAVWLSTGDRRWTLLRLPDPGKRGEALSVSCVQASCWVAGRVDGQLALWSVDTTAGTAGRVADLPPATLADEGPFPRAMQGASGPIVAYSTEDTTYVLTRTGDGWTARRGPTGGLVAATQLAGRLYLATSPTADTSRLWSAEL